MRLTESVFTDGVDFPEAGFHGLILDFDDTITSPLITKGKQKGQRIHDISRILAAREIGIEMGNETLIGLTPEQSEESYLKAAEPTLEGSIAYLLHKAGVFRSHKDYDASNEWLVKIVDKRTELHTKLLQTHVELNPGARELMQFGYERLPHGLAIASMAQSGDIAIVLERFGLDVYMPEDRIVARELVSKPKPNREVFDTAYHRLQIPSSGNAKQDARERLRTVAVDDSRGGVIAASKSGEFAIGLTSNMSPDGFKGAPAKIIVPDLRTIKAIMERRVAA
jgi:beta-phosphoglucomutase-like phosphatase (HAD superfamily)